MATRTDVLQAVAAAKEARQQVPAVLRRLMRYYEVTDGHIAAAFGVSRQTVNAWANARTRIPEEIETGLAAYFRIPKEVMYSTPTLHCVTCSTTLLNCPYAQMLVLARWQAGDGQRERVSSCFPSQGG